jgi:predicted MFS family arabinose efflux permease
MAFAANIISGYIIVIGDKLNIWPHSGFSLLFFLAAGVGFISTYWFSQLPDDGTVIQKERLSYKELFHKLSHYPLFVGFVIFTFLWNFAMFVSSPYFNLYLVKGLGGTNQQVGLVSSVSNIVQILSLPLWGYIASRVSNITILHITGGLIPVLPLLWLLARSPYDPIYINILSGCLWAGFNLVNFNLFLRMIPHTLQHEGAALYQGIVLLGTILGPLVGAEIVEWRGYTASFVASAFLRWLALLVFVITVSGKLKKRTKSLRW